MTVRVGIYDFFAYTLPGLLYMFACALLLRPLGLEWSDLPMPQGGLAQVLLVAAMAYVVGLVFDPISYVLLCRVIHRRDYKVGAFREFRRRYPCAQFSVSADQWPLLYARIRLRSESLAADLDKLQATHKMLRNVALAVVLLAAGVLVNAGPPSAGGSRVLLLAVLLGGACVSAALSLKFRRWFYLRMLELTLAEIAEPDALVRVAEGDRFSSGDR